MAKRTNGQTRNTTWKQRSGNSRSPRRHRGWESLADEQLLDVRICDLGLELPESRMWPRVEKLYGELAARGIAFRPQCWLSDDWFSPDGIPGIAIPFYLAHRRLASLERKQMLEVEGGTMTWSMRILRHEAGHAIDTAFRLHRRKSYRRVFGNYNDPYPDSYRPRPNSKSYVLHLEPWYAQSHPAEDFAETFAVWLKPQSRWRTEYQGWPALKKVQLVDELMSEIAEQKPKVNSKAKVEPVHRIRKTLREYYTERHECYCVDFPMAFDQDLRNLFTGTRAAGHRLTAAVFLQKNRLELCRTVSQWTGQYGYSVNQVLREMTERCRELKLLVGGKQQDVKRNAVVMLAVQTMNYLHGGQNRVAL